MVKPASKRSASKHFQSSAAAAAVALAMLGRRQEDGRTAPQTPQPFCKTCAAVHVVAGAAGAAAKPAEGTNGGLSNTIQPSHTTLMDLSTAAAPAARTPPRMAANSSAIATMPGPPATMTASAVASESAGGSDGDKRSSKTALAMARPRKLRMGDEEEEEDED